MGAILGTVPGWERDARWTPGYRIYKGPAYIKYEIPPERISPERRFEYRVRLDIIIYLCDTPDLIHPLVIREIKGILIVGIYIEEYPGGLEQWISDVSIREAEELLSRSNTEVAGLVPCDKNYDIKTYDEEEILPRRIKRTLKFRAMFRCSKETDKMTDGIVFRYKDYEITEEYVEFPQSLAIWRDQKLEDTIREFRSKCKNIDRELYDYDIIDIEVEEE